MNQNHSVPENAMGQPKLASPYTDKRGYAERWGFSTRKIDSLLQSGLPHLAIGKRRVRICIAEADSYMNEQFRVQRRRGPVLPKPASAKSASEVMP